MNVKLLSYSQPTEEFANLGVDDAQELIAYCARVSNPSNQLNTETSEKLIKYLVKQLEILLDKFLDIGVLVFKNLANDMRTLLKILTLSLEKQDYKIQRIARTVFK